MDANKINKILPEIGHILSVCEFEMYPLKDSYCDFMINIPKEDSCDYIRKFAEEVGFEKNELEHEEQSYDNYILTAEDMTLSIIFDHIQKMQ